MSNQAWGRSLRSASKLALVRGGVPGDEVDLMSDEDALHQGARLGEVLQPARPSEAPAIVRGLRDDLGLMS